MSEETSTPESEFFKEESTNTGHEFVCKNCGSPLKFEAGKDSLVCGNCHTVNEIASDTTVEENDYLSIIHSLEENSSKQQVHTVECNACGGQTTLKENEISADCPYCGSNLIVDQAETHNALKPEYLLSFKIDAKTAMSMFKSWITSLWWAPNALKKLAKKSEKLQGVYYPYWTYDSSTQTQYTGQRGTDYTTTETYFTTDSDGNSVTRTRTVTRTSWTRCSGFVQNAFDDILVVASESLPRKYLRELEPWDLENLKEYDDQYLPGFRAETYVTGLEQGFEIAKERMDPLIRMSINQDIGGDHQRIESMNTTYEDIKFKHLLLPIWISSYRYKDKVYRFVVNGRTGEVQGERPYSATKIAMAIIGGLAVIGTIVYLISEYA